MPAYCLFDIIEVTDPEKMEVYRQQVIPTVEAYQGRYIAVGGPFEVIEGNWQPTFPVMIEFPDLEQAHHWYNSEVYRELKALRLSAVKSNAVFVQGF